MGRLVGTRLGADKWESQERSRGTEGLESRLLRLEGRRQICKIKISEALELKIL